MAGAAADRARDDRGGGRRQAACCSRRRRPTRPPEAARAGLENLARTLSIEWARHGIRTAALLPGAATEPGEVAELAAFLASRRGRLLLGLPLRPGGGVSERYRVTSLDSIEALPGPGSLRWLPVRHELGIGAFGTNAYVAPGGGRRRGGAAHRGWGAGTRSCTSSRAARRRSRSTARRSKAPAGTYVFLPDPEVRRHAVADEPGTTVMSFGAPRGEAFTVSGWEARFRASAIRERDPEQARALYEEGVAADPDSTWAHYDLACWHALYGSAEEARGLLDRAIELGGDEVRAQAREDPDLASLRHDS